MLLFLFTLSAFATGIHTEMVPCPIGGEPTKLYLSVTANELGGFDSDGAVYSSGTQFRRYAISTCPKNFVTLLGTDLMEAIPNEHHEDILERVQNALATAEDPDNLSTWERYLIASEVYKVLSSPPGDMAQLYLQASWVVRDEIVGIHHDLRGPKVADAVLGQGLAELEKDLTPQQRKLVRYNLARVAHRAGYPGVREQHLQKFEALSLTTPEKEAVVKFRRLATLIEPKFQQLAIAELEKIGSKRYPSQQFVLGDLYRRTGKEEQAKIIFESIDETQLSPRDQDSLIYLRQHLK